VVLVLNNLFLETESFSGKLGKRKAVILSTSLEGLGWKTLWGKAQSPTKLGISRGAGSSEGEPSEDQQTG
jgi:hypothetical protein